MMRSSTKRGSQALGSDAEQGASTRCNCSALCCGHQFVPESVSFEESTMPGSATILEAPPSSSRPVISLQAEGRYWPTWVSSVKRIEDGPRGMELVANFAFKKAGVGKCTCNGSNLERSRQTATLTTWAHLADNLMSKVLSIPHD